MKHVRLAPPSRPLHRALAAVLLFSLAPCANAAAQTASQSAPPEAPIVAPTLAAPSPDPVTLYANLRYRLETVDQAGIADTALASTIRVRTGLRTAPWNGLSAVIEGEAIVRLGPANYNDASNGRTTFPVVADAPDVLLNQAYIRWQPVSQIDAVAGRQTVNFDNQRWVGSVDWRQNDQTLDAVRIGVLPSGTTRIDYAYSWRVNRVFGPESRQGVWRNSDIHLLRASANVSPVGTVTAYAYWLDLPAAPAMSSRTIGVRMAGEQSFGGGFKLHYAAEYAHQRDFGVNPNRFRHDYILIEPGIGFGPVTARVGYERLDGNGATALQTPLATLHAFNGWADKFLVTPANGLRNLYADVQWRIGPLFTTAPATLRIQYHDFDAARGTVSYGREYGAWLTVPVTPQIIGAMKVAHYDADRFASDTTKFWLSLEARF